ncbi:MAG: response regulator transcription factor [Chlorobi bacterium]|nr:response regulator transcription factor [Chlorobiota bacterium]
MGALMNIILVENNFLLRSGIEGLIIELPGLLLKEVFDGKEKNLCRKLINKKPDVIIINPNALGDNFISIISKLQEEAGIILIGLLGNDCPENISSRFKNHLPLEGNKHLLLEKLRDACGKDAVYPTNKKTQAGSRLLSVREIDILREVVKGLTNQEIADKLFLSIHTVMTHRKNISKKLSIKTVSGLMVYALMNNIVDINEMG